jgi:hypothetical protein
MRGECNYTPSAPPPTVFLWKVEREYSAHSSWSAADARDDGQEQFSYPVSMAYICKNSDVWFLSLNNEPISGSHFSCFLHILPLKQYNGGILMKETNYSSGNDCGLAIFSNF